MPGPASHAVLPIWAFLAVTVPLVLTPGVSTAVVLRNSIAGGVRAGLETAVGINAGSLCYGLLTAFGVTLLLRRVPSMWVLLRVAGVTYLLWLGWRSVVRAWSNAFVAGAQGTASADGARRASAARNAYEGLMTNLLNPAIATFYIAVVPQFVPAGAAAWRSVLILTVLHISLAATWHLAWAIAGGRLAGALSRGRARQVLELASGLALIALAARMALQPLS